jgi:hypothetical protein
MIQQPTPMLMQPVDVGIGVNPLTRLLHQRGSALTDFLKRHFEATDLLPGPV